MDRIKNMVDEVHKKAAHFLCSTYSTIILPTFRTQDMARRQGRAIGRQTTREMLQWEHYRFKLRLKSKAQTCVGVSVVDCEEYYTTRQCGSCHRLNAVGGATVYECQCGYIAPRDIHGARNNMLRHISIHIPLQ